MPSPTGGTPALPGTGAEAARLIPFDPGDGRAFLPSDLAAIDRREAFGAVGLFEEVRFGKTLVRFQQELLLGGGGVDAQELGVIRGAVVQEELLLGGGGGMGGGEEMLLRGGIALVEQVVLGGDGGLMESGLVARRRRLRRFWRFRRGRHGQGAGGEAEDESRAEEPGGKRRPFHARKVGRDAAGTTGSFTRADP